MCYHDVGQGGVAGFVESQVRCDDGRHLHLDALQSAVNLSCHQHVTAFLQDGRCKRRLKQTQTTFHKLTGICSLSSCFVTGFHCYMYPYSVKVMFLLFWYWAPWECLPMLCTAVCPNVLSLVVSNMSSCFVIATYRHVLSLVLMTMYLHTL